jgi:hypothetical protein
MKNILKAVGAGLALGLALFLVPFVGRLLLFVVLVRLAFRLLAGSRWRRGRPGYGAFPGAPVPIDNQWYRPTGASTGPARSVSVA